MQRRSSLKNLSLKQITFLSNDYDTAFVKPKINEEDELETSYDESLHNDISPKIEIINDNTDHEESPRALMNRLK